MHKIEVKNILSNNNGINIYRGCSHGCIYCDSRSDCYKMDHDFEDIEVKINAPQLLYKTLLKKRKKCMIGTGSMCDPYLHIEKELELTKQCLEIIYKLGFGVSILTKSNLILRDIELLSLINKKTKCVVEVTITTFNEDLCKIIEPNVCSTLDRLKILEECKKQEIPTIVWICPLLPYINDDLDNLKNILESIKNLNVVGIVWFGAGVTLRNGDRKYFYNQLDKHFPNLSQRYVKEFGNNYEVCRQNNNVKLTNYLIEFCKNNNIIYNIKEIFNYLYEFPNRTEQISMF